MIESFGASGDLSFREFPKLMLYLSDIQFEGQTLFKTGNNTKSFYLRKGMVSYGVSDDFEEALDTVLVKYSIISQEVLEQSIQEAKEQRQSLAKYLVSQNHVTPEQLIEASRLQTIEIAKSLLLSQQTSYFLKKDNFTQNTFNLRLSAQQLIFKAAMLIPESGFFLNILETPKRVIRQSDDFVDNYKQLDYDENTDVLIAKIDGKRDIEAIVQSSGVEQETAKKILGTLLLIDLVTSDAPQEKKPDQSPATLLYMDKDTQQLDPQKLQELATMKNEPEPPASGQQEEVSSDNFTSTQEVEESDPEKEALRKEIGDLSAITGDPLDDDLEISTELDADSAPDNEPGLSPPPPPPPVPGAPETPDLSGGDNADLPAGAPPPPPPVQGAPTPPDSSSSANSDSSSPPPPPMPPGMGAQPPKSFQEPVIEKSSLVSTEVRERAQNGIDVDTSGASQYMAMLSRQRSRRQKIGITTLILLLIFFGLTMVYYFGVYKGEWEIPFLSKDKPVETSSTKVDTAGTQTQTGAQQSGQPTTGNTNAVNKPVSSNTEKPVGINKPVTKPIKKPAQNVSSSTANGNFAQAKKLMKAKQYQQAAREWKKKISANPGGYTINVEVACSPVSVSKIFSYDKQLKYLYLLPRKIGGRNCFRICWGLYKNNSEAQRGMNTLPQYYRNQKPAPKVITLKKVL